MLISDEEGFKKKVMEMFAVKLDGEIMLTARNVLIDSRLSRLVARWAGIAVVVKN